MNDLLTPHDDNEELEQPPTFDGLLMKASFNSFFASQCHDEYGHAWMKSHMDMYKMYIIHSPMGTQGRQDDPWETTMALHDDYGTWCMRHGYEYIWMCATHSAHSMPRVGTQEIRWTFDQWRVHRSWATLWVSGCENWKANVFGGSGESLISPHPCI